MSLLIGTSSSLYLDSYLWSFVWGFYTLLCRKIFALLVLILAIFYANFFTLPKNVSEDDCIAIFTPTHLVDQTTPFHKHPQYKGLLLYKNKQIPCTVTCKKNETEKMLANCSYKVQGSLIQRDSQFIFKPKIFKSIENTFCLAQLRYEVKKHLKELIKAKITNTKAATLLNALATGDVEDRLLRYEFSRVGVQHVLAVSGFHFSILILFFSFILQTVVRINLRAIGLFIIVTAYFIFIGPSPSVERSFITAIIFLIGKAFYYRSSGLNLLGIAMGIELLADPNVSGNLGFQFSFLSCFGILLFFSSIDQTIQKILPKRSIDKINELPLIEKLSTYFSAFIRNSLALDMAVNITIFPLLFYHFHQFSLLGCFYNLFFPFLLTIAMFLLLASFTLYPLISPLGNLVFWINNHYTTFLLELTSYPMLILDQSIQIQTINVHAIIAYLFLITIWKISSLKKPTSLEIKIPVGV